MKKFVGLCFLLSVGMSAWASAEVVFVYENEQKLIADQSDMGTQTAEGILLPAKAALAAHANPYIGLSSGKLYRGKLVRLDNEVGLALFELGSEVVDKSLLAAHQKKLAAFRHFLPPSPQRTGEFKSAGEEGFSASLVEDTFKIRINGVDIRGEPLLLKAKRRKSSFQLEVVHVSTAPVWHVGVRLRSEPRLGFWKKGRKKGLNDVPRPEFKYDYQAMFKPLSSGRSFKIPIDVSYIKEDSYLWSLRLKIKKTVIERKIPVRFER